MDLFSATPALAKVALLNSVQVVLQFAAFIKRLAQGRFIDTSVVDGIHARYATNRIFRGNGLGKLSQLFDLLLYLS